MLPGRQGVLRLQIGGVAENRNRVLAITSLRHAMP
jgi:hypothetical protein